MTHPHKDSRALVAQQNALNGFNRAECNKQLAAETLKLACAAGQKGLICGVVFTMLVRDRLREYLSTLSTVAKWELRCVNASIELARVSK